MKFLQAVQNRRWLIPLAVFLGLVVWWPSSIYMDYLIFVKLHFGPYMEHWVILGVFFLLTLVSLILIRMKKPVLGLTVLAVALVQIGIPLGWLIYLAVFGK
jgi:hypothetical protein